MKTTTTLLCFALLLSSCGQEEIYSIPCYHNSYIVDDLGHIVSASDFAGFDRYLCRTGSVLVLDSDEVIYESRSMDFGNFELRIDDLPLDFEIRFFADPYYLNVEVAIDEDRGMTMVVEGSNLCRSEITHN